MALVRHVDGELGGFFGYPDSAPAQHEAADLALQRELVGAMAEREHQNSGRAIDHVAGGQLRGARLHEVHDLRLGDVVRAAQYREDGADGDVDVDVRAAVQRIEQQQVVALRVAVRDLLRVFHFLRGAGGQVTTPGVRLQQDFVGDHVELLLRFALDIHAERIVAAGHAQHATERALVGGHRDAFAGARDHFDQQRKFGIDMAGAAFLDKELDQRDGLHDGSEADEWRIVPTPAEPRQRCVGAGPIAAPESPRRRPLLTARWQQGVRMLWLPSGGVRHARYGLFPGF